MRGIKKPLSAGVLIVLIAAILTSAVLATVKYKNGDVNGDSEINLKDVTVLRRALADGIPEETELNGNPDVNGDGTVKLQDVTILRRYLAGGWGVELPDGLNQPDNELAADLAGYTVLSSSQSAAGIKAVSFEYGESVLGRDLVCWSIQPKQFSRTILMNFEIHGWEDSYAGDGQLLVDLGNALVAHYSACDYLQGCRLLIIPSANPDGLANGVTNNGFGRCNKDGVDLNRDFDANHVSNTDPRYYTSEPFSAPESRALRNLVWAAKPDVVLDFHGWLNYTIGSSELAEVFSTQLGLYHKNELTSYASGYFTYWAQLQGSEALLVEFKDPNSIVETDVIKAVDKLIADNYGTKESDNKIKASYQAFDSIKAWTIADGKLYTQTHVNGTGTNSYIDGSTDECTIVQIYENGWCKVRYPVGNLTKTGYCQFSGFVEPSTAVEHYKGHVVSTENVYRRSDLTTKFGSVYNTDTFTVIAEKDGAVQVIYPLDSGGYKMGWISKELIIPD